MLEEHLRTSTLCGDAVIMTLKESHALLSGSITEGKQRDIDQTTEHPDGESTRSEHLEAHSSSIGPQMTCIVCGEGFKDSQAYHNVRFQRLWHLYCR